MKEISSQRFTKLLLNKKDYSPLSCHLELTYRCNLKCIHCFCRGLEDKSRELSTRELKRIIEELRKEGCLWLCLSGGEPLLRKDFLEVYSFAKEKGFITTIFSNGQGVTGEMINGLAKSPPHAVEITLNGITQQTYEAITQVDGSFATALSNIKKLKQAGINIIIKANCLKQNKNEITKIKALTETLIGRPPGGKHYFKYDVMIYPRLNGDRGPCNYRLSFPELGQLRKKDPDMWKEYQKGLHADLPMTGRETDFLYHCNSWMNHFFINPYGRLKFCFFSDKFSTDLRKKPFRDGFYKVFPQILKEKFKTDSKCRDCNLRPLCYRCPARAYLETGDEEAPVDYYCALAKSTAEQLVAKRGD